MTAENLLNLKKKSRVIIPKRGRLSALSPMEIFIVMLIKVQVVYKFKDFSRTS